MTSGSDPTQSGFVSVNRSGEADERAKRKQFIHFSEEDVALLSELYPLVKAHAETIVDGFYANIQRYPELVEVIRNVGTTVERLKQTQKDYLIELFAGNYGDAYVARRLNIGMVHNKIGLTPRWYIGSYSVYTQLITPYIFKRYWYNPVKIRRMMLAVNKILSFDCELAIDTYIHGMLDNLRGVSMSRDSIESRVGLYREFIENVSTGDLSRRLDVDGDDELSMLGKHLNSMTEKLAMMARDVKESSVAMVEALGRVQRSINTESSGAAQQAASVTETTTTLEEIRATSMQTLEKASALGQAAERTRREGETGLSAVEQTFSGMLMIREKVEGIATNILELSEQTQQIGEITSVVNSLAQQLKMLALNASIEAAKAGDAGKGFAVVAMEVKNLAEQSQTATNQVHKILNSIQKATDKAVMVTEEGAKGVDQGMRTVEQAGNAVRSLSEIIQETATASQQIVAAVRQEAAGIDQIAIAMEDIQKATSQFVTSTQETRKAAQNLNTIAVRLHDSSDVYKF